jgi:hypothetical protein
MRWRRRPETTVLLRLASVYTGYERKQMFLSGRYVLEWQITIGSNDHELSGFCETETFHNKMIICNILKEDSINEVIGQWLVNHFIGIPSTALYKFMKTG